MAASGHPRSSAPPLGRNARTEAASRVERRGPSAAGPELPDNARVHWFVLLQLGSMAGHAPARPAAARARSAVRTIHATPGSAATIRTASAAPAPAIAVAAPRARPAVAATIARAASAASWKATAARAPARPAAAPARPAAQRQGASARPPAIPGFRAQFRRAAMSAPRLRRAAVPGNPAAAPAPPALAVRALHVPAERWPREPQEPAQPAAPTDRPAVRAPRPAIRAFPACSRHPAISARPAVARENRAAGPVPTALAVTGSFVRAETAPAARPAAAMRAADRTNFAAQSLAGRRSMAV